MFVVAVAVFSDDDAALQSWSLWSF